MNNTNGNHKAAHKLNTNNALIIRGRICPIESVREDGDMIYITTTNSTGEWSYKRNTRVKYTMV